jgi:hypothetical protein
MRVGRWLSDCGRLRSAICGEYARKLLWDRRFRWSACCRPCTVNPSRKLRRFESFTCHHVRERASDLRKRGRRPFSYTWWGYRNGPFLATIMVLGSQACDLRKRVQRTGWRRPPCGIREEVWVRATVLAGLPWRLTCQYARGGGMQSLWKLTPSRLAVVA